MQLLFDILLTALSIFVIGSHAVLGKGHFKSKQMPAGANFVSASVLTTLAVFLILLWTNEAPLWAQFVALVLDPGDHGASYRVWPRARAGGHEVGPVARYR